MEPKTKTRGNTSSCILSHTLRPTNIAPDMGSLGGRVGRAFLQLTRHLWGGTWKNPFLLKGAPVGCHVSWREGMAQNQRARVTASFRLWLHLPRCHFGTTFLSHCQMVTQNRLQRTQKAEIRNYLYDKGTIPSVAQRTCN